MGIGQPWDAASAIHSVSATSSSRGMPQCSARVTTSQPSSRRCEGPDRRPDALHRHARLTEGGERVRLGKPDERYRRLVPACRADRSDGRYSPRRSAAVDVPLVPVGPGGQRARRDRQVSGRFSDSLEQRREPINTHNPHIHPALAFIIPEPRDDNIGGRNARRPQVERRPERQRPDRQRREDQAARGGERPRPRAQPAAGRGEPAAFGSRCHDFDGQNTAVPMSDTTAGISVRAATRVTATAMARVGPSDRKMLRDDNVRARNAAMSTSVAEAITSPTRVTDWTIACFLFSPRRSRSR